MRLASTQSVDGLDMEEQGLLVCVVSQHESGEVVAGRLTILA